MNEDTISPTGAVRLAALDLLVHDRRPGQPIIEMHRVVVEAVPGAAQRVSLDVKDASLRQRCSVAYSHARMRSASELRVAGIVPLSERGVCKVF